MFLHTSGRGFPFSIAYRNRLSHINAAPLQRRSVPERIRKNMKKHRSSCLLSACWPLAKNLIIIYNYVHHAQVWGFPLATGASKLSSSTAYLAEEACVGKKTFQKSNRKIIDLHVCFQSVGLLKKICPAYISGRLPLLHWRIEICPVNSLPCRGSLPLKKCIYPTKI